MKRIYKYATGDPIPKNAVYLNTLKQEWIFDSDADVWERVWLVWHYFLVDMED